DTTQAPPTPARKPVDPRTPGRGPGVGPPDTTSSPSPSAPVDPSRVESARRTVLYRSPEGQPAGTLAPSAPLRVLGRSGAWPRARAHRPHPVPRQPGAGHDQPRDSTMNDILRDRLLRKLDALPDDKAYQVLDYVEFLESKYAERPAGAPPFQRVAETLEDTLR